jgi:hypothetical protein
MYDYLIIGSGPAGVSAALRLQNKNTCIVDAGNVLINSNNEFTSLNHELSNKNIINLLGKNYELISNLIDPYNSHIKIRSKKIKEIFSGSSYLIKEFNTNFILSNNKTSYSAGGLSNVWGGQLLRYTDNDFLECGDWPIGVIELNKYYKFLENEIGISGEHDHMDNYLGGVDSRLLPPVDMVPIAIKLLKSYDLNNLKLNNLILGRPRLALITEKYNGIESIKYSQKEFWCTHDESFYTSKRTLLKMIKNNTIKYIPSEQVVDFYEENDNIIVKLLNIKNLSISNISCKKLLIGCGTIETSKLINNHYGNKGMKLPIYDHTPATIPIFSFGNTSKFMSKSFPLQLIGNYKNKKGNNLLVSMYYLGGLLISDFLQKYPIPYDKYFLLNKFLINNILGLQIWNKPENKSLLKLDSNNNIEIKMNFDPINDYSISTLLKNLRILGFYGLESTAFLNKYNSWHHVGTFKMKLNPTFLEVNINGLLFGKKHTYIIDGSVIPSLSAKNHSLTIMANAARIADTIK